MTLQIRGLPLVPGCGMAAILELIELDSTIACRNGETAHFQSRFSLSTGLTRQTRSSQKHSDIQICRTYERHVAAAGLDEASGETRI